MGEVLTRLFFGGFVRLHVFYDAAGEPVYGVEMMEELRRHGYEIGAGTLYPILHLLQEVGHLTSHTGVGGGKRRTYYRATPEGTAALEQAKVKLRELVAEVLHDRIPDPRPEVRRKPGPGA